MRASAANRDVHRAVAAALREDERRLLHRLEHHLEAVSRRCRAAQSRCSFQDPSRGERLRRFELRGEIAQQLIGREVERLRARAVRHLRLARVDRQLFSSSAEGGSRLRARGGDLTGVAPAASDDGRPTEVVGGAHCGWHGHGERVRARRRRIRRGRHALLAAARHDSAFRRRFEMDSIRGAHGQLLWRAQSA